MPEQRALRNAHRFGDVGRRDVGRISGGRQRKHRRDDLGLTRPG
jgi:hypothetical protein